MKFSPSYLIDLPSDSVPLLSMYTHYARTGDTSVQVWFVQSVVLRRPWVLVKSQWKEEIWKHYPSLMIYWQWQNVRSSCFMFVSIYAGRNDAVNSREWHLRRRSIHIHCRTCVAVALIQCPGILRREKSLSCKTVEIGALNTWWCIKFVRRPRHPLTFITVWGIKFVRRPQSSYAHHDTR